VNCRSDEFKIGLVGTVIGDDVYAVIFFTVYAVYVYAVIYRHNNESQVTHRDDRIQHGIANQCIGLSAAIGVQNRESVTPVNTVDN